MRSIEKAIEQYNNLSNYDTGRGVFTAGDALQIKDLADGDLLKAIFYSLDAGYAIGYRTARRELRKKNKCCAVTQP